MMYGSFPTEMLANITEFFESEDTRSPGEDSYQEVFDTPDFFPLQRKRELERMMQIGRSIVPKVVMEIGADKGGGLYHWCKSFTSVKRVIACEFRGTPYKDLFEAALPHLDFLWIEDSSYKEETVERVQKWLGDDKINCLFIDGDKNHFHTDFDRYLPSMSKPGIVFMHDVNDLGTSTRKSFKDVASRGYRTEEVIDIDESIAAEQREMRHFPATNSYEGWLRYWKGRSCGVGIIYLDEETK